MGTQVLIGGHITAVLITTTEPQNAVKQAVKIPNNKE